MPRSRLTHRRLIAEYGVAAAVRLMSEHGGSCIPRLTKHLRERIERDEQMRRDVDDGDTYTEVGERYGVDRSRVARIAGG